MSTDIAHSSGVDASVVADSPAIGFDIGGTNLRAAVVSADGKVLYRVQTSSDGSVDAIERGIVQTSERLVEKFPEVSAIGLAIAGFLDSDRQTVRFAPHLPWRDANVVKRLSLLLPRPLQLEHDANSAAWGEYRFGAARGADNWVLFALGTGIGGAMMQGGKIYRGAYGTAPEFGHLTVVPEGRACACGKRGCLERYCSGTALVTTAAELAESGQYYSRLTDGLVAGTVTGTDVVAAARQGDELAEAALDDFATWLGRGLSIVGDVFDPELVVIGGGVATASDLYLEKAQAEFARNIAGSGYRPVAEVKVAELGADAGLIGVADIARSFVAAEVGDPS